MVGIKYEKEIINGIVCNVKVYDIFGNFDFEIKGRNGKGKLYNFYTGNLEYEGEFSDLIQNGPGKEYDDEGKLEFEGIFLNGEWKKGKHYDHNGKFIEDVEYLNEKGHKKVKQYFYNGKLKFDGEYLDYKKWNGIAYNQNGEVVLKLKEGKGKGKFYDFNSELLFEEENKGGERWNEKGKEYGIRNHSIRQLKFEGEYKNGKRKSKTDKTFCNFL